MCASKYETIEVHLRVKSACLVRVCVRGGAVVAGRGLQGARTSVASLVDSAACPSLFLVAPTTSSVCFARDVRFESGAKRKGSEVQQGGVSDRSDIVLASVKKRATSCKSYKEKIRV